MTMTGNDRFSKNPEPQAFIFFQFYQNAAIDFQNIIVKHYQSDTYRHPLKICSGKICFQLQIVVPLHQQSKESFSCTRCRSS